MKNYIITSILVLFLFSINGTMNAHCDTMDGPVVADAKKALETNNINYILKWVLPEVEAEIKQSFELTMKVRKLSPDAQQLADMYFFETLVRLHRNGEGVAYNGIKPAGTPIDEKIKAADESIETGSLAPLQKILPEEKIHQLETPFKTVLSLKNFDVNDVKAGRAYVDAYVRFFHMAEEEADEGHMQKISPHSQHL